MNIQIDIGPVSMGIQLSAGWIKNNLRGYIYRKIEGLLSDIKKRLPILRLKSQEITVKDYWPSVVKRMVKSASFVDERELTPMACVAGAISDEVLQCIMDNTKDIEYILVNNGGDIAFISQDAPLKVGLSSAPGKLPSYRIVLEKSRVPRGIATSGWRGRSFSKGIADAVMVIAESSSIADAAATLVANHTYPDISTDRIKKVRASLIDPETDIPREMVVVDIDRLGLSEKESAIGKGEKLLEELICEDKIKGGVILLEPYIRVAGDGLRIESI